MWLFVARTIAACPLLTSIKDKQLKDSLHMPLECTNLKAHDNEMRSAALGCWAGDCDAGCSPCSTRGTRDDKREYGPGVRRCKTLEHSVEQNEGDGEEEEEKQERLVEARSENFDEEREDEAGEEGDGVEGVESDCGVNAQAAEEG